MASMQLSYIGFFWFEVAVEDKSLQHHPQVCTMKVQEIMYSTWAFIEMTCCVPFLKSYKAKTEGAKLILAFHSRGYNFLKRVQNMSLLCIFSKMMSFLTIFM